LFPTIHHFIKLYKKEHGDYKILSHKLQKMESELIFKGVIKKMMLIDPDIKFVTVHDSIIVQKKHKQLTQMVFDSVMSDNFEIIHN